MGKSEFINGLINASCKTPQYKHDIRSFIDKALKAVLKYKLTIFWLMFEVNFNWKHMKLADISTSTIENKIFYTFL